MPYQITLLPIAAFVMTAADTPADRLKSKPIDAQAIDNPAYVEPAEKWDTLDDTIETDDTDCNDTITQARAEAGLPKVERETASPDEPLLIYAIDRKQDGCSVMIMAGNTEDIRPLPENPESSPRMMPADSR